MSYNGGSTPSFTSILAAASAAANSNSSTTSIATPPTSGHAETQEIRHQTLLLNVNIFLFSCIALYTLLSLPRFVALLRTSKEWSRGHILGYTKVSGSTSGGRSGGRGSGGMAGMVMGGARDPYTTYNNFNARRPIQATPNPPPHISSCPSPFRLFLTPLRSRIIPGFSGGQLLILVGYLYLMGYACVYKTNFLTDPERTGWVSVSQMPLLYALASKGSWMGSLLGVGYEKLNYLHRFAGLVVVLTADLHSLRFIYKQMLADTFGPFIRKPANMWGLIATICFNLAMIFSTTFWRNKAYNIFHYTHIVGFTLALPALYMHKPDIAPYVFTCIAVYGLDRIVRVVKTRIRSAHIRIVPELDLVRLEVPSINSGWRAGQHVRLRVLSTGMGVLGWSEVHPFTIASAPESGNGGMVLYVKRVGRWTRSLYEIAEGSKDKGGVVNEEKMGLVAERKVNVVIEGPYGGPCRTIMSSFSGALFVCGGSGITFGLAAIGDLLMKDEMGKSRVKCVDLVWTVTSPSALTPVLPELTRFIQDSAFVPIRIAVHYTRAQSTDSTLPLPFLTEKEQTAFLIPGLTIHAGRPKMNKVLDGALDRTMKMAGGPGRVVKGLVVGVCGPVGLADEVVTGVNGVEGRKRDQVGGIEIVEEVFGW